MNHTSPLQFYDEGALLERLSNGLRRRSQEVIFLVGAPMSAPPIPGGPGVPDVEGVIDLIRGEFPDDPRQVTTLDKALDEAGDKRYQVAFQFLQGRRGQQGANEIVRRAVLSAWLGALRTSHLSPKQLGDDDCRQLDLDGTGWVLGPGTASLGALAATYPELFGKTILTTNFDPLIEVSIRRAGGHCYKTALHADGNISQTDAIGCHVVHLHGYWYGSDTLHTARQLGQPRPYLKDSLRALLQNKLVVVCAYGGWDDVFTEALMEVVRDVTQYPEILWTFHTLRPTLSQNLSQRLEAGINRGRVNLYSGIDCNAFFPQLFQVWSLLETRTLAGISAPSNPVRVSEEIREQLSARRNEHLVIEGDDEDRPPRVEFCVGREAEMEHVGAPEAKVVFLTGLGGQGKSTVAAQYFEHCQAERQFTFYVWRDCKEESERFENQVSTVIEKLSAGKIRGEDLSKQEGQAVVEILIGLLRSVRALFVFDNVDHYVDLENEKMSGALDVFIEGLLKSETPSKAIFTCRPSIRYESPGARSIHLTGLDLHAAIRLFEKRGAPADREAIKSAHELTEGHAFWLDLLAIQVAKPSANANLTSLVNQIRSGLGPLPEKTLASIWATLKEREQFVLRAMAETVKPVSEAEISEYLRHEISYSKVLKALKTLTALNLVVVKRRPSDSDVLELHPMVRQFIQRNFQVNDRMSFINAIIKVYQRFMGNHKSHLAERPTFTLLQYWTQNAELDITARRFSDAFRTLAEVAEAFLNSAYGREYCRVARELLTKADWVQDPRKFKQFEEVFDTHVEILSHLGNHDEVDVLLQMYAQTVSTKDVRYIHYCAMMCQSKWIRGEFADAVRWGKEGRELKAKSDVDTSFDVAHELALAERDAGQPESALSYFVKGRQLAGILDPDELDDARGGAHYGNIGRCLHFMGQIDEALICYQKSALLIERDPARIHVLNQGYIRLWIGELLAARQQYRLADVFLRAAYLKWEQIAPPKASKALDLSKRIEAGASLPTRPGDNEVENICLDWILGRSLDSKFR